MSIIISHGGKGARKLKETGVKDEAYLQQYVADNPDSLPLDDLKEDLRLLVIAREFATLSGNIDVLAIDRDGDLYIIETKRYKNPDKRFVLAQLLDYGASLWRGYPNPEDLIRDIDQAIVQRKGKGLDAELKTVLGLQDDAVAGVKDALKRAVLSGSMKFIVLMDKLDERLRNLILFVNQKSRFDIYAVEMEFYEHDGLEIVVPRLHGAEVQKEPGVAKPTKPEYQWDDSRFAAVARSNFSGNTKTAEAIVDLLAFSRQSGGDIEFKNADFQGRNCKAHILFPGKCRRAPYSIWSDGALVLNFNWLNRDEEERLCQQFREELRRAGFGGLDGTQWKQGVELNAADWVGQLAAFKQAVQSVLGARQ